MVNWALTLNRNIAYIGPRLIQQGKRQYNPQRTLTPDAQNLTDVVAHLQPATPTTTFDKLLLFMRAAFPEIETITVNPDYSSSPALGEPAILSRSAPSEPIPLRLSGSGVEQMLALAVGP